MRPPRLVVAAVPKAMPKAVAKARPKAAPTPGAQMMLWDVVLAAVPAKRIVRSGTTFYHARCVVGEMGLKARTAHLAEKIPMLVKTGQVCLGSDVRLEAAGHCGIKPFWLSQTAAKSVYDKCA